MSEQPTATLTWDKHEGRHCLDAGEPLGCWFFKGRDAARAFAARRGIKITEEGR